MPSRNTVRDFSGNSMYHVYNRGVEKRDIFLDQHDYEVFLSFLKHAFSQQKLDPNELSLLSDSERYNFRRLNIQNEAQLISYCLMPNHFHLLIFQNDPGAITKLMRSLATGYSMYFNKRYKRVGTLFQGKYKASKINTQSYWEHISRYIHLNPLDIGLPYEDYPYSSYKYCIGTKKAEWLQPDLVLEGFMSVDEYKKFHEDYLGYKAGLADIKHLLANE